MKLTSVGLQDQQAWEAAGFILPSYDIGQLRSATRGKARWVHLGIGNIFRIFIGGIAEQLIEDGRLDSGLVCVETYDFETIDRIYRPYDNLSVSVILHGDGTQERRVLGEQVGYAEGMEFVEDPGILSPKAFIDECMQERFPNPYLGDTVQRLCCDESQGLAIRFGENVKACVKKYGSAQKLTGIALALAGWLRYMMAVDDEGNPYELSPDPMNEEMTRLYEGVVWNDPDSLGSRLQPVLSNERLFGMNLYEAGIGGMIEEMVRSEMQGPGSVCQTLAHYLTGAPYPKRADRPSRSIRDLPEKLRNTPNSV